MMAREGSTNENSQSFSIISLTECQEALSEKQFGKQTRDRLLCLEPMFTHEALVLIPKHIGDFTDFSGLFPSKMKLN